MSKLNRLFQDQEGWHSSRLHEPTASLTTWLADESKTRTVASLDGKLLHKDCPGPLYRSIRGRDHSRVNAPVSRQGGHLGHPLFSGIHYFLVLTWPDLTGLDKRRANAPKLILIRNSPLTGARVEACSDHVVGWRRPKEERLAVGWQVKYSTSEYELDSQCPHMIISHQSNIGIIA